MTSLQIIVTYAHVTAYQIELKNISIKFHINDITIHGPITTPLMRQSIMN